MLLPPPTNQAHTLVFQGWRNSLSMSCFCPVFNVWDLCEWKKLHCISSLEIVDFRRLLKQRKNNRISTHGVYNPLSYSKGKRIWPNPRSTFQYLIDGFHRMNAIMVICCHHGHFPNHSASLRKVSKMFKERWFQTTYTLLASKSLTIFFVPQIFSALRVPVSRIPLTTLVQNTDPQRWGRSCQGFYILAEERVTCKLTNKVSSESDECNEEWQDNSMTRKTPSWGTSDAQPAGMEAASPTKAKLLQIQGVTLPMQPTDSGENLSEDSKTCCFVLFCFL